MFWEANDWMLHATSVCIWDAYTDTHILVCPFLVPRSFSCHFTAPQVSRQQTDASLSTSPLFAAQSITGHAHTRANYIVNNEMHFIVNTNTTWQSFSGSSLYPNTHTHSLPKNARPNYKPVGENDLHNCCWVTAPPLLTHTHTQTHTDALSLPPFLSNSIPFSNHRVQQYPGTKARVDTCMFMCVRSPPDVLQHVCSTFICSPP